MKTLIILFFTSFIAFVVFVIFTLMQRSNHINARLNKLGTVTVSDRKYEVKTISCWNEHRRYYICRIDYGPNAVPRFGEVKFHESEITFTEKIEGE